MQENTDRQLNKTRKTIHKQNEKFNKEIENMRKNQAEILEQKHIMKQMKNMVENFNNNSVRKKH